MSFSSRAPSLWSRFRQILGRAFRETGQALDRVGIRGLDHARGTSVKNPISGDYPYKFGDHLSRHRQLFPMLYRGQPVVSPNVAYLAPCCTLIGTVHVGANSSVWYGAIVRGDSCINGKTWNKNYQKEDTNKAWEIDRDDWDVPESHKGGGIFIGEGTNLQDGCIVTARQDHTVIGNGVTIGHLAQIHSATVQDYSLIGMGSILLENSLVQTEAFVAAGAVVSPDVTVPTGELWVGQPARKLRDLTEKERKHLHYQSSEYVKVAQGQSQVMELGGNLPESLVPYTMLPDEQHLSTASAEQDIKVVEKQQANNESDERQQEEPLPSDDEPRETKADNRVTSNVA